ncbi:pilus assembly protein [Massilia sp. SM-13]|uniref:pilus assembly protein n=1 Tax=Pseudoduganella rhizocola TaxID=3382643 RepID=UPI0038B5F676
MKGIWHIMACTVCLQAAQALAQTGVTIDTGQAALGCGLSGALMRGPALAVPTPGADSGEPPAELLRTEYKLDEGSGTLTRSALWNGAAAGFSLSPARWNAATELGAMPPAARNIYTLGSAGSTISFQWNALSDAQRAALDRHPPSQQQADGLGEARLAWLRGERSREGHPFRVRSSVLGASVHGNPVYLAAAPERPDIDGYAAYRAGTLQRKPAVYLGANDGMLHAFDFNTGKELLAYVPDALFPFLNLLTTAGMPPRAYVDGPLFAGDAHIGGQWRSVLLAAMGGGAPGLFALDVTDPERFSSGRGVLWEFTERDDPAIGNLTVRPQVARLQTAPARYRHYAVTGNGLNAEGEGALFLLALDKPPAEAWQLDINYHRLALSPAGVPNALGSPALVGDGQRVLHAYAGDLRGNLWRFDFTGKAPWKQAARALFTARGPDGLVQPILQTPRVAFAPNGGYLVLFGTGLLLSRADRIQSGSQSFYAIYDDPGQPAPAAPLSRADLLPRHLDGADGGPDFTVLGRPQGIGPNGAKGWFLDFRDAGERSLGSAVLRDGKLLFVTTIPGTGPCDSSLSRSYQLDVLAGLPSDPAARTGRQVADFIDTPPLLLPAARTVRREASGRATVTKTITVVQFGAEQTLPQQGEALTAHLPAGRLSWREIANWRELHRAAGAP